VFSYGLLIFLVGLSTFPVPRPFPKIGPTWIQMHLNKDSLQNVGFKSYLFGLLQRPEVKTNRFLPEIRHLKSKHNICMSSKIQVCPKAIFVLEV
jgi:hypothetical protein